MLYQKIKNLLAFYLKEEINNLRTEKEFHEKNKNYYSAAKYSAREQQLISVIKDLTIIIEEYEESLPPWELTEQELKLLELTPYTKEQR